MTCTTANQCPTTAYACGVDGFCHAPGGALGVASAASTFEADVFRVTDIDGDGIGDVVGLSTTSMLVRFGDASGGASSIKSFVTPAQTGPVSFGHLDGDASLDVTITTPDGLVSYTSPYGELSPIGVQSLVADANGMPVDILAIFPIDSLRFGALVSDNQSNRVDLAVVDLRSSASLALVQPCVGRLGVITRKELVAASVVSYTARTDVTVDQLDAVVSFTAKTATSTTPNQLCIAAIHETGATFAITDVTPAGLAPPAQPFALANLGGDAGLCPGLVDSDDPNNLIQYVGSPAVDGHCKLADLPSALPPIPTGTTPIGRFPFDPPYQAGVPPGFTAAPDALVTTDGVYIEIVGPGAEFIELYTSPRTLRQVAFGDNGDGITDAILIPDGEDDLDILYRHQTPALDNFWRCSGSTPRAS